MADVFKKMDEKILEESEKYDEKVIADEKKRIAKHEDELKDHVKGLEHDYLESRVIGEEDTMEVKEARLADDEKKLDKVEAEIKADK